MPEETPDFECSRIGTGKGTFLMNSSIKPLDLIESRLTSTGSKVSNHTRDGFMAQCPAHDDSNPSLHVSRGNDGRVLLHCHAGCSVDDICAALGISMADLHERRRSAPRSAVTSNTTAIPCAVRRQGDSLVYEYRTEGDAPLYEVVRRPDKRFIQHSFDDLGDRVAGLQGRKQIPFGLPELVNAKLGTVVHVTEGEKDCITLRECGVLAVSMSKGAISTPDNAIWFANRDIIIHVDNDEPGRKHAANVAAALHPHAKSIRLVSYEELAEHGDVSDFLTTHGGTIDQLLVKVRNAPLWSPQGQTTPSTGLKLRKASAIEPQEVRWIWPGWMPSGMLTLLGGYGGSGKSTIALSFAAALSTGGHLPDGTRAPVTSTMILAAEDSPEHTIIPRLLTLGADLDRVHIVDGTDLANDQIGWVNVADHAAMIQDAINANDIGLVVIDPISSFIGETNSDKEADVRTALMPLVKIAESTGVAVLLVRHLVKGSESNRAASRILGSTAWTDVPRCAWMLADAPESHQPESNDDGTRDVHRVMGVVKSNLAAKPQARWALQPADGAFTWLPDASPVTIEQCFAATPSTNNSRAGQAETWLTSQLRDTPLPTTQIEAAANEAGISERTLRRARKALGVQSIRHSDNRWWLHLPEPQDGHVDANPRVNGRLGCLDPLERDDEDVNGRKTPEPRAFSRSEGGDPRAQEDGTFGPLDEKRANTAKAANPANSPARGTHDSSFTSQLVMSAGGEP